MKYKRRESTQEQGQEVSVEGQGAKKQGVHVVQQQGSIIMGAQAGRAAYL